VIERAENANHQFSEIGRVSAANTANQNTYVWDDSQPLFSSYYRIRTIDFDGQSHYSHVIHIARANILTLLNVAPVPTQDKVTISFNSPELLPVTLMLTDVSGRILSKEMIQPTDIYNETTLDLTSKASGIYYLLIHDGKTRHVEKLIRE
jgi:hypothetical protein